ncbi:MAG: hypothetical protein GZ091_05280 [Paludibacter sp.]|nr:hypothetical protein [Paludibacter sp.]
MRKNLLLIIILILSINWLNAQVNIDTPNLSFSDGSLNGWKLFIGDFYYDNGSTSYIYNWTPKTAAQIGNRISIIGNTSTTSDSIIACSGFYTNPDNKLVARLGVPLAKEGQFPGSAKAAAERMEYSFKVTANTTLLSYKLAAVLRVPPSDVSHLGEERPTYSMEITVKDVNGVSYTLPCSSYSSKADNANTSLTPNSLPCFSSDAGTNAKDYVYQKWISGNIDLSLQIGKTVTINIINHDCLSTSGGTLHAGAHESYGYFWAETKKIELSSFSCENSDATITAPQGFTSYSWKRSDGMPMTVPNPAQPYIVKVDKSLNLEGVVYSCAMDDAKSVCGAITVSTTIIPVKLYPGFSSVAIDAGKIQFTDTSKVVGDIIKNYYWDFGDGFGYSNLKNPIYTYSEFKPFNVKLTITSTKGCDKTVSNNVLPTKELIATITPPANLEYNGQTKDFSATTNIAGLQMNIDYYIRYKNRPGTPFYNSLAAPTTVGDYKATFELSYLSLLKYFMNSVPSKDFSITRAPLTVTVNNVSKIYGQTISLLREGFSQNKSVYSGDKIYELELKCNGLADTSSVGIYTIKADSAIGLGVKNYDIQFVDGTLTVNPKLLNILAVDNSKIYGELINTTGKEFFVALGSMVGNDSISSVTVQCNSFDTLAKVGTDTINVSNANGYRLSNYAINYKPATLLVKRKKITVSAKDLSKVYGTTYTFNGKEFNTDLSLFVGNDSISELQFVSQATPTKAIVSEYSLSITGMSGYRLDNYDINLVNSSFKVTPMPVTISATNSEKEYGDLLKFSGSEFTTDKPLIIGDTVSFIMLKSSGSIETAPIGKYDILPSLAYGAGTLNYNFTYTPGALNVVKKKLIASLNPPAYLGYNAKTKDFTATINVSGLIQNADYYIHYINKPGTPEYNSFIAPSSAGDYTATFKLSSSSLLNYDLTSAPSQDFNITKAPLTITSDDIVKIYGDSININQLKYGFKTDIKPLYGTDRIDELDSISSNGVCYADTVGNYQIIPFRAKGKGIENYEISFVPGKLKVTPKSITIRAVNTIKVYGDSIAQTSQNFYVDVNNLIANDTVLSVILNCSGFIRNATIGNYQIKASNAKGRGLKNYLLSYSEAILQISKKEITVTANAFSKLYGNDYIFTGNEFTTDCTQFVGNDSIASLQLSSDGILKKASVGDYNILINSITGYRLNNYNIKQVNNTLKVTPLPVIITANNITKPYGELFSFVGNEFTTDKPLVNGDEISFAVLKSSGCAEISPVNDYEIFALQAYGVGTTNYDFNYQVGKLSVVRKTLTAKIFPPAYLVYNAQNKEFTASVNIATLAQNTDYYIRYTNKTGTNYYNSFTAPVNVGEYTATFELSGLSELKYSIDVKPSQDFNITKAPLTITADNATKTYGERLNLQNNAFKLNLVSLFGTDIIYGVSFNCKGLADTASVATYPITPIQITGSGIENYDVGFVAGTLAVFPKKLTVRAVDGTKIYGDILFPNIKSFYLDVHELVSNDMVTSVTLVSDGYISAATIGSYKINATNAVGTRLNNYLISYADGNLQVLKKKISVYAKAIYKEYGCEYVFKGDEFEANTSQFVGSDKITGVQLNSQGAQSKASVGEYTLAITNVSGNGIENYDITTQNGILFITPKSIVVIGRDMEKEYGDVLAFSGREFTTDIPMLNGDTISFAFLKSNGTIESASIGIYDIIPAQASGFGSLNYTISYRPGKLKVVQKQLQVTAQNCVKEYGENDPEKRFSVIDKRGVDFQPSIFSGKITRETGERVGEYKITKGTLSVPATYTFTFNDAYLSINKALPTIEPYFSNNEGQFFIADVLGSKNGDNPQGNLNISINQANYNNTIAVKNGFSKCMVSGLPNHMVEAEFNYLGDDNYLPTTKKMNIYAVVYHANGGKLVSAITNFDGSESVKIETPSREDNYIFEGWYENEDFSGVQLRRIPVATYHDVHLYAKWTVSYDDLSIVVLFNQVLAVANPLNRDFLYNSTYKWYKDDVQLESSKQYCGFENFVPSGNYKVEIYYLSNAPIVLELNHSSIIRKAKVYPNPLLKNSELTLSSDLVRREGVSVEIYNLSGIRQTSVSVEKDDDKFRLNGFNYTGKYILRLVQDGEIKETYKVIVEN